MQRVETLDPSGLHPRAEVLRHDPLDVIDVGDVLAITDFFVITAGANDRQVRTIVEDVERVVAEHFGPGVKPRRIEGLDALHWVLMDYGSFVVHVFDEETRRYYDLERLWGDMPRLEWRSTDL